MRKDEATVEQPFLNSFADGEYVDDVIRTEEDNEDSIYDVVGMQRRRRTHISQMDFDRIYNDVMRFFTESEKFMYRQVQTGEKPAEEFLAQVEAYLKRNFPNQMSNQNDFDVMMDAIIQAVFKYDKIQPIIDDPETTDIKICGPYDIRARIHGKAYRSNAHFLDDRDLFRFVDSLALRNGLNILERPVTTFTDRHDENYILRFTISSPFVNAVGNFPYLHIRKVPKTKPDFDELIRRGMLTENVKRYLIGRAKSSKAIVFAGPPGSGKTTALNAFIEYIPKTRESLVIQENDELFTEQSGFMFKHVTHGFNGEPVCTLEDLGKMALVEGCNEFIIGEVKGGEMRYAMTLVNAGGYAALTVHSTNEYETLPKLADLVKYGSDYSYEEARRMLKTFDTVVYMEGYKIRAILEVEGYDDEKKDYIYRHIYKYQG